jgi:L-ascorbate metabolism protein UlaG (beta-lactamase superfamily)
MPRVTWLGHATVLIEIDGIRLLTDPVLRTRVAHLRRQVPTPAVPERLDGVLISHVHHDHLDVPSLRVVGGPGVVAVVAPGVAPLLGGLDFGAVRQVEAGATAAVGAVAVEAVPAWHSSQRGLGGPRFDAVGFLAGGVWFAGDTDLHADMAALRGRVDIALLPVWGWGPSLGPGHLDPERAGRAVAIVRPRVVIPIHWGTFLPLGFGRRHRHALGRPPAAFAAHVRRLAPEVHVAQLAPGESLDPDLLA